MIQDTLRRSARIILAGTCGLCLAALWLLALSGARPSRAANFTVTQFTDDNGLCDADCSLREAILAANAVSGGDTIVLPAGVHRLTITGTFEDAGMTGDLDVTQALTLTGAGAEQSIIDAAGLGDRALHVLTASVVISGVTIRNGSAPQIGPSLEGDGGGTLNQGTLALLNSAVISNSAYRGGGLGSTGTLMVSGSRIVSNSAGYACGGLLLTGTATVASSEITSNTAETLAGGLGVAGGQIQVIKNTISYNTATYGGGLVGESVTSVISANTFVGNTADIVGGGVFVYDHGQATLINNTFTGNTADYGGGLYASQSYSVTLRGNIVVSNTARYAAGGLAVGGSNINSEGDLLIGNLAQGGGGIILQKATASFTNSVVISNQARLSGSGLVVIDATLRLLHATIHDNTGGDGSGVLLDEAATALLTNTIIASQAVGITATAGSTAALDGVLWFGNGANRGGAGNISIAHARSGDPRFAADGYHLLLGSVAISGGIPTGVTTDIDGQVRDAAPDLGADEYLLNLNEKAYLPLIWRNR